MHWVMRNFKTYKGSDSSVCRKYLLHTSGLFGTGWAESAIPGETRKLRLVALEMGTEGRELFDWVTALAVKRCKLNKPYQMPSFRLIKIYTLHRNNGWLHGRGFSPKTLQFSPSFNSCTSLGWTNSGFTISNHQKSSAMNTITLCWKIRGNKQRTQCI